MKFLVSVIIPVYNCEHYIAKAIGSALEQSEVFEIVVVNDGSTDKTVAIVEDLCLKNDKIKLFHHPNKTNKGRSASRNLAIQKANGNFIAFLDADDFYLPNRFLKDKLLLENDLECDGVYNAIGAYFYRETSEIEKKELQLTTVKEVIDPATLFEELLLGRKGYFSIDGLIIKKTIFEKTGLFSEELIVAEDTELILKMALKGKLIAGITDKPVTLRGVHEQNSFSNKDLYEIYRIKMYDNLLHWSIKEKTELNKIAYILNELWNYRIYYKKSFWEDTFYWIQLAIQYPNLISLKMFLKNFPLIRRRRFLFTKS